MPLRYRRDSLPDERPTSSDTIEPTDADDSIVLSDLLRTGEASRLRRRGAMRLDHNQMSAQRNEGGRTPPPPPVVVARTPSWIEPPSDDDESTQTWEPGDVITARQVFRPTTVAESYCHTLYCGGEEPETSWTQTDDPYERSPLPSYPALPPPRIKRGTGRRQTNGCGAVIHMRASRRGRASVWVGKDEATSAVIPMDASYFERATVVRMIRSNCGCVREGVGCAICGNTLGTRYKPCQAAAEGLFSPHHAPLTPLCPEGPRYWHGRSSASSKDPSTFIYTFFNSNVSCATRGMDSRRSSTTVASTEEVIIPVETSSDYNFFDRLVTESPLPMTEQERDASEDGSRSRAEPQFDPDGAIITSDPGSPDKIGAELPLLPER
ncbi:hypothetical protein F5I97DRAFT_1859346 [Phlebopus sp. FC_14]|nr:hypothetical protein F5I97DRAFT_1859346 [Phlebopus sp. FC_14]